MIDREFFNELADEYEDVFEEGREARRNQIPLTENPYRNSFATQWILGWTDQDMIELHESY